MPSERVPSIFRVSEVCRMHSCGAANRMSVLAVLSFVHQFLCHMMVNARCLNLCQIFPFDCDFSIFFSFQQKITIRQKHFCFLLSLCVKFFRTGKENIHVVFQSVYL